MAWSKLEISVPDLKLPDFLGLIEKLKQLLEALVAVLEAILNVIAAFLDPIVALIKALIEKIKDVIEGFLKDLGAYVLYVPIRKRLMTDFLGLGDITPSWADGLGIIQDGVSPVNATNPELNEFIVKSNRYDGGNGGFFRTIIESLYDEGDLNRPQFFDATDFVGGIVLVMGANIDPLGFLDDIWSLFKIFDGPETVPKIPKPKNLRVRPMTNLSTGVFDALLTWDPMEVPLTHLTDLGNTIYYPYRYAVIRGKNNCSMLSAQNILDLMGKRTLAVGDTFGGGSNQVVYEGPFDISKVSYLDTHIQSTIDDSFYYAVAWKLKAFNADEKITADGGAIIDYWQISNIARAIPFPSIPASTPPDWYRTPSIESLFPAFAELLRRIVAEIEKFASRLTSGAEILKSYVEFLKSEIRRYEELINYFLDKLAEIIAKLQMPKAGVYMRTFKGEGGMNYFLSDLARSLLPGYKNHPPFDQGDEYVTGVVILAGGLELTVDGLIEGLSWIFGTKTDSAGEMEEALAQLNTAVENAEDQLFGHDMQPTTTPPKEVIFDPALCPVNCNPAKETPVTFNSQMQVVNPNAST